MPLLVIITGPIAAGKNTVAERLAARLGSGGRTAVLVDLDDVAVMVAAPGAAAAGLWFAAHQAHGALVGQWMRSDADVVIAVGPIYSTEEREAITSRLPNASTVLWVVVEAPLSVTLARAQADPSRGLSRDPAFHTGAHRRFRDLESAIPADLTFDSSRSSADSIASGVADRLGLAPCA